MRVLESRKWTIAVAIIAVASLWLLMPKTAMATQLDAQSGSLMSQGGLVVGSDDEDLEEPADTAFVKNREKQKVNKAKGGLLSKGTYYFALATDATSVLGSNGSIQEKDGSKSQAWKISFDYDTQCYTVLNAKTGKALTALKKATDNAKVAEQTLVKKSQRLTQYATRTVPIPTQRWILRSDKNGYYFVSAQNQNVALDLSASKARVVKRTSKKIEPYFWPVGYSGTFEGNGVGDGAYTLKSQASGGFLNIQNSSVSAGKSAVVGKGLTLWGQVFQFQHVSGKYYKILNYNSGLALTASGGTVVQSAYKINTKQRQLWSVRIVGKDGAVQLINKSTQKALEVSGGKAKLARSDKADKKQRWYINPTSTGLTFVGLKALYRANKKSGNSKTAYCSVIDMTAHEYFLFKKAKSSQAGAPYNLDDTCRCATGRNKCTSACITTMGWRAVYKTGIGAKWCIAIQRGSNLHSILFGHGGNEQLGWNISHGCVRIPFPNAEHVYKVTKTGTKIIRYYV